VAAYRVLISDISQNNKRQKIAKGDKMRTLTVTRKSYHRRAYSRQDGTEVKAAEVPAASFKIRDRGKPGPTPERDRFYHPVVHMGWHKDQDAETRRGLALKAHKNPLSAARALQELANVTTDKETALKAHEDASYFYEMHSKEKASTNGYRYAGSAPSEKLARAIAKRLHGGYTYKGKRYPSVKEVHIEARGNDVWDIMIKEDRRAIETFDTPGGRVVIREKKASPNRHYSPDIKVGVMERKQKQSGIDLGAGVVREKGRQHIRVQGGR
jgi:hypothetical protein